MYEIVKRQCKNCNETETCFQKHGQWYCRKCLIKYYEGKIKIEKREKFGARKGFFKAEKDTLFEYTSLTTKGKNCMDYGSSALPSLTWS